MKFISKLVYNDELISEVSNRKFSRHFLSFSQQLPCEPVNLASLASLAHMPGSNRWWWCLFSCYTCIHGLDPEPMMSFSCHFLASSLIFVCFRWLTPLASVGVCFLVAMHTCTTDPLALAVFSGFVVFLGAPCLFMAVYHTSYSIYRDFIHVTDKLFPGF